MWLYTSCKPHKSRSEMTSSCWEKMIDWTGQILVERSLQKRDFVKRNNVFVFIETIICHPNNQCM